MMNPIQLVVEFAIPDGKLDAVKKLVAAAIEIVEANEPGALSYQYYFNDDESQLYLLELHRDAQAVLGHLANAGEIIGQLLETTQVVRLQIFGDLSDDLEQAVAPFSPQVFKSWDGFTR